MAVSGEAEGWGLARRTGLRRRAGSCWSRPCTLVPWLRAASETSTGRDTLKHELTLSTSMSE